ncbi:MAG: ABC transporter ATP-binding protein [Clostridia bacterium]|nr:ABC transporter ATP-binding protein [Clostridia bacterium]
MPRPGPRKIEKPKNPIKTFKKIFTFVGKYKWQLLIVVLATIGAVGANLGGTYLMQGALSIIENFDVTKATLDETLLLLGGQVGIIIAVYLVGIVCSVLSSRLVLNIQTGTLRAFREAMFEKMEKLPIKYFDTRTNGEIMARYTTDTDAIREMISNGIPQIINSTLTVIGAFTVMLIFSPLLTVFVIGMLILMLIAVTVVGGKGSKYFIKQQASLGTVNGYIEEYISGQKVVQVFCREEKVKEGFNELNEDLCKTATSAQSFAHILMPIMGNLSYINYVVTAVAGAILIINGKLEGGVATLIPFLNLSRQFSMPLTQISQQFNGILSALAGAERIFALMEEEPEVDEGYVTLVNAHIDENGVVTECEEHTGQWAWKHFHKVDGTTTYVQLRGAVEFENVTFGYEENKTVLKNISLYAKPGQKIALVGSTGAGKTTITNLINRFYDVPDGKIRYDGININKIKKDDLRRSLAMVLQDTHLFTGTVRENIRYGNLNATDEQIEEAAKLANAHNFIMLMPDGYDTIINADGSNLSQGQRQLLAIARAAVADPPVLILDEATSSIDTRTEALIEQGMDKLMEGRTVFVIAHRLSTVRNSNAIMVIEQGEIIERGNHDQLIEKRGRYYQLYNGMFELS